MTVIYILFFSAIPRVSGDVVIGRMAGPSGRARTLPNSTGRDLV